MIILIIVHCIKSDYAHLNPQTDSVRQIKPNKVAHSELPDLSVVHDDCLNVTSYSRLLFGVNSLSIIILGPFTCCKSATGKAGAWARVRARARAND